MKTIFKTIKGIFALACLPILTGCSGGGGGGGSLASLDLGSLFGSSEVFSSTFNGGGDLAALALLESTGGGIPVVHNPEPASMILMGTGIAAMAYFKRKR